MPTAYSISNYRPTQPRSFRQWAGLTAAAAFGALVAEGAATAAIAKLLDGAMRGLPSGTTLGDRYGLGALPFVAAAVFAANICGGAAGGFVAAAASRLDVRRKDLPTLRWYFLGIGRGFLGLNLGYADGDTPSHSAYLNYTLPLGDARSAGASLRYDDTLPPPDTAFGAELQRAAPLGSGYGYRLSGTSAGSYDTAWIQQFEPLAVEADAARFAGISAQRLALRGGATYLGGELRATRAVNDSFALVDAGGIGGLTVYVDNQPVTHTDASGQALVRNLRPYEANRIGIDTGAFMSGRLTALGLEGYNRWVIETAEGNGEIVTASRPV